MVNASGGEDAAVEMIDEAVKTYEAHHSQPAVLTESGTHALEAADDSVQEIRAIKRVALFGDKSRVANQPPKLLLCRAVMGACGGDYVFLDHDASDIVAAEAESELAYFHPGVTQEA